LPFWPAKKKPKGKSGQATGCTSQRCPHTSSGHCSNVICGNYWQFCPVHGLVN